MPCIFIKNRQGIYEGNVQAILTNIKENLNNRERILCSLVEGLNIVKIVILTIINLQIKCNCIKILVEENLILNYMWEKHICQLLRYFSKEWQKGYMPFQKTGYTEKLESSGQC